MGRLIDEDLLIKELKGCTCTDKHDERIIKDFCVHAVHKQPTAYDPEEVVKQLEAQKAVAFITLANTSDAALDASYRNVIAYLDGAIEIVRNGGAK